jgi:adenylyltransferase/sulfurtransferase
MSTISPAELAARLRAPAPPHLVDVREAEEHAFCALNGATLLPLTELGERFGELGAWKDDEIVVYCHHGVRSAHAIAFLRGQGFSRLTNLSGGIDRWSTEVDPQVPRY